MDNQNPQPNMQQNNPGIGSVIATVIIIILIIIGALYFWGQRLQVERQNQAALQSNGTVTELAAAAEATRIETVSSDDSISTLQKETQETNTSNIGAGF